MNPVAQVIFESGSHKYASHDHAPNASPAPIRPSHGRSAVARLYAHRAVLPRGQVDAAPPALGPLEAALPRQALRPRRRREAQRERQGCAQRAYRSLRGAHGRERRPRYPRYAHQRSQGCLRRGTRGLRRRVRRGRSPPVPSYEGRRHQGHRAVRPDRQLLRRSRLQSPGRQQPLRRRVQGLCRARQHLPGMRRLPDFGLQEQVQEQSLRKGGGFPGGLNRVPHAQGLETHAGSARGQGVLRPACRDLRRPARLAA